MKNNQDIYDILFKTLIATLLLFFFSVPGVSGGTGNQQAVPSAISGVLNLLDHDLYRHGTMRLDGQWQFYPGRVHTPEAFLNNMAPDSGGYYTVPKYWTAYKDLALSPEGIVTYRLLILVNQKNRPLSLLTPEIFTEYRLFINGELMDSHGRFSDHGIRFLSPQIYTFQNKRDTIEIVLNIANNNHANAGIGQSFFLGSPEAIQKQHLFSTIIEMVLVAVCLFAGIYHILLFSFRRKEKELFYFGLFCILIALRTVSTGTTFITQMIPEIPFEAGSRVATGIIPLCVMAFQIYAYYFFKPHFPVKSHGVLLLLHSAYFILSLTLSPMGYSNLYTPYLLVIVASCVLIICVNGCAVAREFQYAVIFLGGFLFVFAGVANDMLHYMQVINTGYFLSLWFSFFIVAQSSMLAIKFANEHRMVEALSKKLQAADKLKDEFLANTSHELRTPVNGIIGISNSLIDGIAGNLSEKAVLNLKLISLSGKRLASLINDILDYSKLRHNDISLAINDIDLRQITQVVLTVVKATIPSKKLDLINDVKNDFPPVRGDENRLQQVLFNLIGNAVKFTQEGHVRVFAQECDSYIIVHVEDTGAGIPAHMFGTIFESFEQVDGTATRTCGGTGLGLTITRKLVELQGGKISVNSVEGKGSVFSFSLQKGNDGAAPTEKSFPSRTKDVFLQESQPEDSDTPFSPSTCADKNNSEKILIVDDDTTNVQVLQNYLVLENHRIVSAMNGMEAIEILEHQMFDLVLLDIMMPRMSGYEVLKHIRKQYTAYELPVLMLTAGKRNQDVVAAFQSGANDYLTKPIDRQELMARIRTQLSLRHAVANAIENANLANTDALTGLYNRRFMIHFGSREYTNAVLLHKALSLIMLDIDLFKGVNDQYGHAEGDRVLKHLAGVISKNVRAIDVAARYGGEEFVIILPGTNSEGARRVAEKIRQLVEESRVETACNDHIIQYTISLGTASLSDPEYGFEDLLNEADKMLYKSKNEGRNKVSVSPHF